MKMKSYTITVNGNVYDVTVEENGAGAAPAAAPRRAAAPAAPAAAPAISLPTLLPYTVIGMLFGVIGSFLAKKNMFNKIWKALINGVCIALVSTCIAVPITATLYGGFVGTGASGIAAALMAAGWGVVPATFVSELSSEMMDKIICLIIIFFVLKAIPARLVVKLPNGKYFVKENE